MRAILLLLSLSGCSGIGDMTLGQPSKASTNGVIYSAYIRETWCQAAVTLGSLRTATVRVDRGQADVINLAINPRYQGYVLLDAALTPSASSVGMRADQDALNYPKHYSSILTLTNPQADGTLVDLTILVNGSATAQIWFGGAVQTVALPCVIQ